MNLSDYKIGDKVFFINQDFRVIGGKILEISNKIALILYEQETYRSFIVNVPIQFIGRTYDEITDRVLKLSPEVKAEYERYFSHREEKPKKKSRNRKTSV
jgi:hypothetical protein